METIPFGHGVIEIENDGWRIVSTTIWDKLAPNGEASLITVRENNIRILIIGELWPFFAATKRKVSHVEISPGIDLSKVLRTEMLLFTFVDGSDFPRSINIGRDKIVSALPRGSSGSPDVSLWTQRRGHRPYCAGNWKSSCHPANLLTGDFKDA
ncbi:MAG TPA: hypothetical protein VIM61_02325 [Chthoniobacterales bacterium]